MTLPSPEFLLLASTLLSSLPPSGHVNDQLLLQLSSLFGPMLMSALQIVDRKEVVRISLPYGRDVYQVASSSGQPYTLHLNFRDKPPIPSPQHDQPKEELVVASKSEEEPQAVIVEDETAHVEEQIEIDPPPISTEVNPKDDPARNPVEKNGEAKDDDVLRSKFIWSMAGDLERMYCPCTGFMYNSLSGDKNVLCKHLLAAVIAHETEREVRTEVGLAGVVGLLGLGS